jgi:hypothetical protein
MFFFKYVTAAIVGPHARWPTTDRFDGPGELPTIKILGVLLENFSEQST